MNKNIRKSIHFIFISIILFVSCQFEPKNEYIVDVTKEPYGPISIDLMQTDTIILIAKTSLTYKIETENGQKIYESRIMIDDHFEQSLLTVEGKFTLNPDDYENGFHQLQIEVYTSSGTGSLADIGEAEALFYSRSWVLIVDRTKPVALKITNISDTLGMLKLEWEKNKSFNFQSYEVRRILHLDNYEYESIVNVIHNVDSNYTMDKSYIGGKATYWVNNVTPDENVQGYQRIYINDFPKFKIIEKINGDSIIFKWNKCKYDSNFSNYYSQYESTIGSHTGLLKNTIIINDTTASIKLPFGESYYFDLITDSKNTRYSYENPVHRISVYTGDTIPKHKYMAHSNIPGIIYLIDFSKIYRYSLSEKRVLNSTNTEFNDYCYSFGVSPNGDYVAYSIGNEIYIVDPVSLSKLKTIDLKKYFNGATPFRLFISNNGLLSISVQLVNTQFCGCLYDIATDDTLFTKKYFLNISESGKYLLMNNHKETELYNYSDGMQYIGKIAGNFDKSNFNPLNEEELIVFKKNSIEVLYCNNLFLKDSYIHNLNLDNGYIDPVSKRIMLKPLPSSPSPPIYIIDPGLKKIVAKKEVIYLGSNTFQYNFFNNELFSIRGYKLELSE